MRKLSLVFFVALLLAVGGQAIAVDLGDAIAAAEKTDPTLASAQANRDAAFENIAIAKAKLLPQTGFQGTFQKMQEGVKYESATAATSSSYMVNSYNNQFSLRQGLYHPRDWAGYDIGQLQSEYGSQKLASARSDLWQRITNAWLDVLVAVESRRIYEDTVKVTHYADDQAEKRFQAGDGTRDMVIEARAQYELAKSQLVEAEINERSREQAFRMLTGLDAADLRSGHLPDYKTVHIPLSNKDELQRVVEASNPEIRAAEAANQINKKRVEQAHADRLPTVDLVASKSWAQSDNVTTINQRYNVLGGGVQISIPLYDGGGLSATQRQTEATARGSAEDLRALQLKLATQVESDWATTEASLERARSAEVLWVAAKERRRAAELGITSHVHTWGDVAQAEILIAHRASDYINYAAGVLRAQARLLATLPVTENIWEPWVAQVSVLAKP